MSDAPSSNESWSVPCEGCGARLEYAPGTEVLECPYCGNRQAIVRTGGEIREYRLDAALAEHTRTRLDDLLPSGQAVSCENCSAITVLEHQADRCPYCDSPVVVDLEAGKAAIYAPESVLPFGLDRNAAKQAFRRWVKGLWFAPNDLWKRARAEAIDGVYLPYWTFDSRTATRYTGQRGEHYWVTEHYTDAEGQRRSRQVRRTRWYPATGTVRVDFDDLLICATRSLPDKLIYALEPWDLGHLRPFAPAYLSGFLAERYRVELNEGFDIADQRMRPRIRTSIHAAIGGDEQRINSMDVAHSDVHFKHLLLPLWISSFRYRRRVYRFIVNARTGEVAGERPWSWLKITLAVIAVLVLLGLGLGLAQR
ncbi:MAG: hypothetical protein AAGE01_05285 [Pseudomonadota bacterium]